MTISYQDQNFFKINKKLIWDTEDKYILPTKSHENQKWCGNIFVKFADFIWNGPFTVTT